MPISEHAAPGGEARVKRSGRRLPWLLAAVALAACENPGYSGRDAEFERVSSMRGFAVVSAAPERAIIAARGQRIIFEPPQGYCLDEESIAVSNNAAFALIADCMQDHLAELTENGSSDNVREITLPRVFPGILTVAVSGETAYGTDSGALDAFEAMLGTETGLSLLSRGNNGKAGKIIATRRIGGALYVLIDEPSNGAAAILGPRFWRAFIAVSQRLVLVTVSGFNDRPIAEDLMMGFLALQMAQIRRANRLGADAEEDQIAADMTASLQLKGGRDGLTVVQAEEAPVRSDGINPERAPVPPQRGGAASATGIGETSGRGQAPLVVPYPPRRPG
jgi:hypothetical protein